MKSYVFHYWFAFPAITFPLKSYYQIKQIKFLDYFDSQKVNYQLLVFIFFKFNLKIELIFENMVNFQINYKSHQSFFAIDLSSAKVISVKEGVSFHNCGKKILFGLYDPNSQSNYPGWPLRNYLALLALKW